MLLKVGSFPEKIHAARVALSVMVAYFITLAVATTHSYWVLITVVFVSQPNVGAMLSRSKQRALSTMLGVLVGGVLVQFLGKILWLNAVVGVVCVFLGIFFLLRRYDIFVFFLTVIIILAFGFSVDNVWEFVLYRFVDTLLGIIIVVVFSLCFFPISARQFLRRDFLHAIPLLQKIMDLTLRQLSVCQEDEQLLLGRLRVALSNILTLAERHFVDLRNELPLLNVKRASAYAMIVQSERIRASLYAVNALPLDLNKLSPTVKDAIVQLNDSSQKIFTSILLALQGEVHWHEPHLIAFLSSPMLVQLKSSQEPEHIFLYQRMENLSSELSHFYQACQHFSEP